MRTAAHYLIFTMATLLLATSPLHAEIPWQKNLRTAHAQAQAEGKLLLLHFYSDNCVWCDRLEEGSFKAPAVTSAIGQNFVPVKVHANRSPQLAQMFRVTKFPTDVIVTTDGTTLAHSVSPQDPDRYVAMLSQTLPALANAEASDPAAKIAAGSDQNEQESDQPEPNTQASTGPGTAPVTAPATRPSPSFAMPPAAPGQVEAQFAGARSNAAAFAMPGLNESIPPAIDNQDLALPAESFTGVIDSDLNKPTSNNVGTLSLEDEPELAMQGFCPVTVISEDRWVEGTPEFGVIHLGKLYLFTNNENMEKFLADPVPYTPVLNEIDVVRFFEERKIVPGKREWGLKDPVYNRMFFFADEAAMNHFYEHYGRYVDAAIDVMDKAVKEANPQANSETSVSAE